MGIVTDLIYIILAALVGGFIAHILRQPLIFGYILAGVMVGPNTGGFTVERLHDIEMLAEVGVALLLFTLGLEFSFGELKRLAKITFIAAPLQIIGCSLFGYLASHAMGLSVNDALWIGAAISLSSTMVVLKTLASRDALDSSAGRMMFAFLIAQDLAVIPMMLILPQLTSETINYSFITDAIIKSFLFLGTMYIAGTRILPSLFSKIADLGSRELFFLFTLGVAFGTGYLTHELGLSFALGAFIGGMLLSETDFNHQALSDVASLRDLFGLIFFVSVGMLFDPKFFIDNIAIITALVLAIVICKALIIALIIKCLNFGGSQPWTVGFGLSQVGEFAFVIANAGSRSGNLSSQSFSLMISVTVVSMIATPGLFWLAARITSRKEYSDAIENEISDQNKRSLSNHVVIIGGGVVGQYVARVLAALGHPYVVIENDYKIVTQMRDMNMLTVFGDGSHRTILETAQIPKSKLVVITTTNDKLLTPMLAEIRQLHTLVPVVVRVEEVADLEDIASLQVHEIVQPQMEVGLEIVRQALLALGIGESESFTVLGQLRAERYQPTKRKSELSQSELRYIRATRLLRFLWQEVTDISPLAGHTIQELNIRQKYGVSVVSIIRGEEFFPTPKADFKIEIGDLIGILGTESQIKTFHDI